ncbi:MAG: energy-coupling factor transporter transmembrane protein EcfT [Syntrophomonadaceae bacterium]|nr:energy-coupling factor transporter transmembrane protein EcfT [Syntrophomonadaceae bacterium]
MSDAFSNRHPLINFSYFVLVILFSMFLMDPACLVISLLCAFIYSLYLKGKKALKFFGLGMLPLLLVTALLNPLFNHAGVTILFYLPGGNPVTMESIVYGLAAATMFVTVIIWFSCFNAVMTSDKFIYLFGKILPALSLILAMVLRFVPRIKAQGRMIANAQKCVGRDAASGNIADRARAIVRMTSIMTTWALESSIDTADSMKARGYGLPGRTAFSIYCFNYRDGFILTIIFLLAGLVLTGLITGATAADYFPALRIAAFTPLKLLFLTAYAGLGLLPVIINGWEDLRWKHIQSAV